MKRKIAYILTTSALVMGAFFIGKSAQLNHSIPTEDIVYKVEAVGIALNASPRFLICS